MTTPTLEQRILSAAADPNIGPDEMDALLDKAEESLNEDQLSNLLDKAWLLIYERCMEAVTWPQED